MFLDVVTAGRVPKRQSDDVSDGEDDADETEVAKTQEAPEQEAVITKQVRAPSQTTNLRDLFAPREEEGSFRYLLHVHSRKLS